MAGVYWHAYWKTCPLDKVRVDSVSVCVFNRSAANTLGIFFMFVSFLERGEAERV
jgi:hypothetical protein